VILIRLNFDLLIQSTITYKYICIYHFL